MSFPINAYSDRWTVIAPGVRYIKRRSRDEAIKKTREEVSRPDPTSLPTTLTFWFSTFIRRFCFTVHLCFKINSLFMCVLAWLIISLWGWENKPLFRWLPACRNYRIRAGRDRCISPYPSTLPFLTGKEFLLRIIPTEPKQKVLEGSYNV